MGRTKTIVVQGTVDPALQVTTADQFFTRGTKQANRCRDPIFAFLLYGNIAAITAVAASFGSNPFSHDNNYTAVVYTALACGIISLILSAIMFFILLCIPSVLIKTSLILNLVYSIVMVILGFIYGSIAFGILGIIIFLLTSCYTFMVWSRIPFATSNLLTATTAIKSNCGVEFVAYLLCILAAGWSVLWVVAVSGISDKLLTCETTISGYDTCYISGSQYGYLFLLFISYFFTHQVIQNCIHTIVSGVIGTWWFSPDDAKHCCAEAVYGSFIRTMTTSFGSICFGSILVAIIQALRQLAYTARSNNDANPVLACFAECILSCLESVLEYFNKWAFVYVGLYGYSYIEAGKNVMILFKNRGWDAIIADNLVGTTMLFLSIAVGLITGGIGILFQTQTTWYENFANDSVNKTVIAFVIGFVVGLVLCSILMSTIASGVNATIVCFAEAPAEFDENHPALSEQMRRAWNNAYPGCI